MAHIKSFVTFAWQDNLNNVFDKPTAIFKPVLHLNQKEMH